jgi:hypothetical protein
VVLNIDTRAVSDGSLLEQVAGQRLHGCCVLQRAIMAANCRARMGWGRAASGEAPDGELQLQLGGTKCRAVRGEDAGSSAETAT